MKEKTKYPKAALLLFSISLFSLLPFSYCASQTDKTRPILIDSLVLPKEKNNKIEVMRFENKEIAEILKVLFSKANLKVSIDPEISFRSTLSIKEETLEDTINKVLKSNNLSLAILGDLYIVFHNQTSFLEKAIFFVPNKLAREAVPLFQKMLTPGRGSIQIDERTNSIIVEDSPEKIAEIKRAIGER